MDLYHLTGFLVHRTDVKMTNYFMKTLKPYIITPDQLVAIARDPFVKAIPSLVLFVLNIVVVYYHFISM